MRRYFSFPNNLTPPMHPRIVYPLEDMAFTSQDKATPNGWYENAGLITTFYMDDPVDANNSIVMCVVDDAITDKKGGNLWSRLQASGFITELTESQFNTERNNRKPPGADVRIQLDSSSAKTDSTLKTDIENAITAKGYKVEFI